MTSPPTAFRSASLPHSDAATSDAVTSDAAIAPGRVSAGLFRLLETSSDLIAVFGPELGHVYANDGVCRLMGLAREDILGRRYDELPVSPENAARMQAAIAAVFETGAPARIELRGKPRPGRPVTVFDVAYHPELADDGRVELVIGVSRDVSQLRFAEERWRVSAERLGILLDSAGVSIIEVDRGHRIRSLNRLAETELRAITDAPAVGQSLAALVPESRREALLADIDAVFASAEPVARELDFVLTHGVRRFSVEVRPERDDHGLVQGVVLVARDVTLERQREAQLHLSERLASLGRIAAGVAHEIANPLSSIYGNLELVSSDLERIAADHPELGARLRELTDMLRDAHEGAGRIRYIIEDIGLLARADGTPNGRVDLEDIVGTVVRMLDSSLSSRVALDVRLAALPLIAGSGPRLAQVVSNLLQNAFLAMPPEREAADNRIVVELVRDGSDARLTIADNGSGITPEVRARVFDPFFTTRPVGAGMGLGLTIAHGIVASHGGSLTLESTPGEGTTVTIRLPLSDEV